ncbi:hypothetical protein ACMD2_00595 [Ananas comosus]|uniref:Uncharacterized protein n=1 Tax=Ananas comosus TaxID=4615 RepID=A0A199VDQ7_ANACO|nr:hypothetical protein ACMD2_00595 [Ananas comosus]
MITLMPVSCWKKGMRMAMYIPPWMLDSFGFLTGGHEIIILILNIFSAADLQKHFFSFFCVPSLNEGVWGVGEEKGAEGDDGSRDCSKSQTNTPTPVASNLRGAVVDEVGS